MNTYSEAVATRDQVTEELIGALKAGRELKKIEVLFNEYRQAEIEKIEAEKGLIEIEMTFNAVDRSLSSLPTLTYTDSAGGLYYFSYQTISYRGGLPGKYVIGYIAQDDNFGGREEVFDKAHEAIEYLKSEHGFIVAKNRDYDNCLAYLELLD